MAEKKPEKKGGKPPEKKAGGEEIMPLWLLICLIILLLFLIPPFFSFLAGVFGITAPNGSTNLSDPNFAEAVSRFFMGLISTIQVISAFTSLLLIIGIIFARFKTSQLKRSMKLKAFVEEKQAQKKEAEIINENKKWNKVLEHVASSNPSDWRLSVLEADILLAEVLEKIGLLGDTVGERLKSAKPEHFKSLQSAWEAHKIRNSIAHEGSDFALSQREAKRAIGLFEEVFKEFHFI